MAAIDADLKVCRIAALTLTNAMIFQQVLAERDSRVESLSRAVKGKRIAESLLETWTFILEKIDYVPIFTTATEILKSNFLFITPYESNRKKWKSLEGINLYDGQRYQIAPRQATRQDKVVPDSFRIVLNQYLKKPEVKSLSPDGTPCTGTTQGLLGRARIVAGNLIPVGKETDRHWEQGEDPSMLDSGIHVYEKQRKMVVADQALRDEITKHGLRQLMRVTKLSQHTIEKVCDGKPVRRATLDQIQAAIRTAT